MSWYTFEKEVLCLPMFTFQVVKVVQDSNEKEYVADNIKVQAKLTTVTLVEVPYQDMLKVREVKQNSLIWFDEPEKEVEEEEKPTKKDDDESEESSEEDLAAEESDDKSPHQNYKDLVSKVVAQKFDKLIPFKFIDNKVKAIKEIKSSVKCTLIVSGRAGIGLIDSIFQHDMTPASTIANIIILCNKEKKMQELKE
jgi:hypothetical protein